MPEETFESGIRKTVEWYLSNRDWVNNVKSGAYKTDRTELRRTITVNILLFGKTGQVGWELQRALAPLGNLIALDVLERVLW